ncbi:hypothetical protein SAMN05421810_102379 [Amycolatopsis arida]|uniref:Uncharacterized protein n=1 Tax=Amycolatopsis arida TaxID=587909 RepID=A0A1I5PT48_9PSEU|nr:hypothetical protein [Amycolatopsis arida]TDX98586.1 hypothetical protein CLV69_101379 [Amycolatopsis arida]SFP36826.1 hypothetical protein SAMN05421810_102379 [Amycolatopsis arida]
MRTFAKIVVTAGVALAAGVLPVTAASAQPQAAAAPVDLVTKHCGKNTNYVGYIRRPGKDALCLRPGTRTWGGFEIFECAGKVTVYFKDGTKFYCGAGVNFPKYGGLVKTVATR